MSNKHTLQIKDALDVLHCSGRPDLAKKASAACYELENQLDKQTKALHAVLLFFNGGNWNSAERDLWKKLTMTETATTKTLCDCVRIALAWDDE